MNSPDAGRGGSPGLELAACGSARRAGRSLVEDEADGVEDELPAKARSGPNSRLALAAGVNAAWRAPSEVDRIAAPRRCAGPTPAPLVSR